MKTLTIPIPPELEGSFPLVLYFGSAADADEFSRLVQDAKPGMVARPIDPSILDTGRTVPPAVPVDMDKVEAQEREMHRQQRERFERRRGNNQY